MRTAFLQTILKKQDFKAMLLRLSGKPGARHVDVTLHDPCERLRAGHGSPPAVNTADRQVCPEILNPSSGSQSQYQSDPAGPTVKPTHFSHGY